MNRTYVIRCDAMLFPCIWLDLWRIFFAFASILIWFEIPSGHICIYVSGSTCVAPSKLDYYHFSISCTCLYKLLRQFSWTEECTRQMSIPWNVLEREAVLLIYRLEKFYLRSRLRICTDILNNAEELYIATCYKSVLINNAVLFTSKIEYRRS